MLVTISAIIFTALTGIVILFQGCLAAGVPWGEASMGGKYPGKYPPKLRIFAVLNMIVLAFISMLVLSESELYFSQLKTLSRIGIWVITVFFLIGTIMNTITPSKIERIWAPVAAIQFVASLIIALN